MAASPRRLGRGTLHAYFRGHWRYMLPVLLGGGLLASGGWIYLKAELAQLLLQRAWAQSRQLQQPVRPWPWADTWPVARLYIPGVSQPLLVLQGDSGRNLAFGPGLAAGSHTLGSMLISGHRDTHFQPLQHLRQGDVLALETATEYLQYQVMEIQVMDSRSSHIINQADQQELLLLTCYPFDAVLPGGPLRYLVRATSVAGRSGSRVERM